MTIRVKVQFANAEQVRKTFEQLGKDGVAAVAKGLYRAGNEIMTDSKRNYVPVDTGVLRSTGGVTTPTHQAGRVMVQLYYGGNAAPYAVKQHETLHYRHRVGQAKYLERPALARANQIGRHIEDAMKAAFQRAVKR